jgi:hypothetical protein
MRTDTTDTLASTGTPTDSANSSSSKEDPMSPVPRTGAPTDSAHSAPTWQSLLTPGTPPTPAPPEVKKRTRPQRFSPKPLEARAAKVKERAARFPHEMVQSDLHLLDAHLGGLDQAANAVSLAQGTEASTRAELGHAERALRPPLQALCWVLRVRPGGRKFVTDHKAASELVTAEKLLAALPTSGFTVPAPLVHALVDAVAPTRTHFDAWTSASTALGTARARFLAASGSTRAAITTLNSSVTRARVHARLQPVAAPTKKSAGKKVA